MSDKPPFGKRILRLGLYLFFLFIVQEIVVRICFPLPEFSNLDRMIYESPNNPEVAYLGDLTRTWQSQIDTPYVFQHHMNRYGFRDSEWSQSKPRGRDRILFIGDSFVEGVMASDEETIPQGFLNSAGSDQVEVLNAGMVGRGLSTYLQAAADLVPIYNPDVLVVCIYANDLGQEEPFIPEVKLEPLSFPWYIPRFYELVRQQDLHGSTSPAWGKGESRSYFPLVPKPSNPLTKNAEVIRPLVSPRLFTDMEQGRFNPFRTNSLYKEELYLKQVPKLGQAIPFLKNVTSQQGTRLVIVYLPIRHQVTRHYMTYDQELCLQNCSPDWDLTQSDYQLHQQVLTEECQRLGVEFLDMSNFVKAREMSGDHLYWNYDEHMRGEGYLQIGTEIAYYVSPPVYE